MIDDSDEDPTYQPDEEDLDGVSYNLESIVGVSDHVEDLDAGASYHPDDSPVGDFTAPAETLTEGASSMSAASGPKIHFQGRREKKNICPFCNIAQSKFSRHIFGKHKGEFEVQRALAFPVGSKERQEIVDQLICDGNFKHNAEVLRRGEGTLVPGRCPPKELNVSHEYLLPCGKCKGFFSKKNLFRHRCNVQAGGRHQVEGRRLMPSTGDASPELLELMACMRDDAVTAACRQDSLILEFGVRLFKKLGHERHLHAHIREKMRELGRLLVELKKDFPEESLQAFIHPARFLTVVGAVNRLTGAKEGKYANASLALKLGYSLASCAGILKTQAILKEENELKTVADDFLELYEREWKLHVSGRALATLSERKWNEPEVLPMNKDVQKITEELDVEMREAQEQLARDPCFTSYARLSEAVLTSAILFNRRRPGETSRLTVKTYTSRDQTLNSDIVEKLSPMEKELCTSLGYVVVRGKRGMSVPVMLTERMRAALDQLIEAREEVGISPDCPYIFTTGTAPDATPLRGSDCIRKVTKRTGVSNVTATKYRKHAATMLQLLQLSENEMDIVARFMGHDIRVHRQFYRLPEKTVHAAKISKILMAMDQGIGKFSGSTLEGLNPTGPSPSAGTPGAGSGSSAGPRHPATDEGQTSEVVTSKRSCVEDTEPDAKKSSKMGDTTKAGQRKRLRTNDASPEHTELVQAQTRMTTKKRRAPWTEKEKEAVERHMDQFIKELKCPGMIECTAAIHQEPDLSSRSWKDVKYRVYNMILKHKRDMHM